MIHVVYCLAASLLTVFSKHVTIGLGSFEVKDYNGINLTVQLI